MTMTDELKSAEFHAGREVCYSILGQWFLFAPSDKGYKMLEDLLPALESLAEDKQSPASEGLCALNAYMAKRKILSSAELSALDLDNARAYTRLFCLTDSVPISESYYTSRERLVMQESRDAVLRLFKQTGFEHGLDSNEPEDHIGLELMFLSYLAMLSKNSITKGNETRLDTLVNIQKDFYQQHLLVWVGEWIKKTALFPESAQFWLPLVKFTVGYIEEDSRLFI